MWKQVICMQVVKITVRKPLFRAVALVTCSFQCYLVPSAHAHLCRWETHVSTYIITEMCFLHFHFCYFFIYDEYKIKLGRFFVQHMLNVSFSWEVMQRSR